MRFSKMHGLGNDFVVVDCRAAPLALDAAQIRLLGDRHFGVGFDQLLAIEPARDPSCAFAYSIWNTDGTPSGQCGNGLRCVAHWLDRAGALPDRRARLESPSGPVEVELLADGRVRAAMGEPRFDAGRIPLDIGRAVASTGDGAITCGGVPIVCTLRTDAAPIEFGAVSMGNPHAVVQVGSVDAAPVAALAAAIRASGVFPQGCNVGCAEIVARDAIRLRVDERGVGETLACGSGACAAVAVLRMRGALDASVQVRLPGGSLAIEWQGPGNEAWMTGPATFVFEGEWQPPAA